MCLRLDNLDLGTKNILKYWQDEVLNDKNGNFGKKCKEIKNEPAEVIVADWIRNEYPIGSGTWVSFFHKISN